MKKAAGLLISGFTRQHIITLPRSAWKRIIFEETARFLDVPVGEKIMGQGCAQLRKFNCWITRLQQRRTAVGPNPGTPKPRLVTNRRKELASAPKVPFDNPPSGFIPSQTCRVVQLVAHLPLEQGVLGSSPSAAAFPPGATQSVNAREPRPSATPAPWGRPRWRPVRHRSPVPACAKVAFPKPGPTPLSHRHR